MKDKLIKNYKLILGMILGVIISASSVFATSVLTSDKVSYDNTNSKLSSTNIKDAIDEVNTKVTTKLEEAEKSCPSDYSCTWLPKYFAYISDNFTKQQLKSQNITDFTTIGKNVFAAIDTDGSSGVCMNDGTNGGLFCIKANDFKNAKASLDSYFDNCPDNDNYYNCTSDTFNCHAYSSGEVYCRVSGTSGAYCYAFSDGTFNCK